MISTFKSLFLQVKKWSLEDETDEDEEEGGEKELTVKKEQIKGATVEKSCNVNHIVCFSRKKTSP